MDFSSEPPEDGGPLRAHLKLVLLKIGEGQGRGALRAEDLRAEGDVLGRDQEAHGGFVLSREEHAAALDAAEVRGLEIRQDDDLPPAEPLDRVILPDPRDDLPSFVP